MLKLNDISFSYNKNDRIIDHFNLEIQDGEILAIQGKSGCGKSTVLRIIAGLEKISNGTIYLDGMDITNKPSHLRNVGYVFQNHALFPHLTIRKNIEFGLSNMNKIERNGIVLDFCEKLEITSLLDRYPHEISGGQKQRVALARTLVTRPKVILLDEPFTALDQELKDTVRRDIYDVLKKEKITTILVTHDPADALAFNSRIIRMQN